MKKCILIALLALVLSGCAAQPTFETVADGPVQPASATMQQVLLELPEGAQAQTGSPESPDKLYICNGFTVSLQTMTAGDLDKTLRTTTGYGKSQLTLMETASAEGKRYRCVWASAGEGQTQVGKTCIVDDGNYHYVLTVMVPEADAGKLASQVAAVMESFQVVDENLSTGS